MLSPLSNSLSPLGISRFLQSEPELTELAALLIQLEHESPTYQAEGGSLAAAAGDPLGQIQDLSGNAEHASQSTSASKPTLRLNTVFNGKRAWEFDGGDALFVSLSSVSGSYTGYWVLKPDSSTGIQYLHDAAAGRIVQAYLVGTGANQVGWYDDNAWRAIAAPSTSPQILTFHFSGTTGTIYRNGASLGSATYNPRNLGGAQALGNSHPGSGAGYDGLMAAVLIYGAAHNSAQRASVHNYLSSKYGVPLA